MPQARATDPQTSHEAAESITAEHLTKLEVAILEMLKTPMIDEQLCGLLRYKCYEGKYDINPSDSGIRTRRCELAREGKVVDTGMRAKTRSGRNAIVWKTA